MFTILRETGMRADEVLSLNVGDVTLDAGREGLRVREAKNGYARMVVLTPDHRPRSVRGLRAWLRDLGDHAAPTIPLVRSNRGTRVSYDALHYRWVQVCRAAALVDQIDGRDQPRYTIHQLRHIVGSTLITQYPEQIVSRMLGHHDPRSIRRYAEITEMQVRAALAERRWYQKDGCVVAVSPGPQGFYLRPFSRFPRRCDRREISDDLRGFCKTPQKGKISVSQNDRL